MKTPYPSFGTGPFFKISPSDILSARCAHRVLRDDPPHTSSGPRSPARLPLIDQTRIFPLRKKWNWMLWRPGWPDLRSSPDVVGAPAMLLRCACLSAPPGTIYDHGEIPKISSRHLSIMHGLHSYTIVLVAVDHCNFWQIPISILGKFRCKLLANSNVNSWKIPLLVRRGQRPALIVSASPETSSSVIPMVGK